MTVSLSVLWSQFGQTSLKHEFVTMTTNNTCELPSLVAAHNRHFIHDSFSVVVNIIVCAYLAGAVNTVAI